MDEASRREALAKLEGYNDPLRMRILTALVLKPSSANDLAAELDLPIGRVRYQLGRLRKAGLTELRELKPRRGVVERVYFIRLAYVSSEDVAHLTVEEITRGNAEVLKAMVGDAAAALRTGTFVARHDHAAVRIPMRLDEVGWKEAAEVQQKAAERLLEIHASSSVRLESCEAKSIDAFAFLLLFEAAPPEKPKKKKLRQI